MILPYVQFRYAQLVQLCGTRDMIEVKPESNKGKRGVQKGVQEG